MVVLENQQQVEGVTPDINAMIPLGKMVCITAPGEAVAEDPVTGSTHAMLIPYWGKRLGRQKMDAIQVSRRRRC